MAEIKVEKKKPIWPWIILALIILAILYFVFVNGDDEEVIDENNQEQIVDTENETSTLEDNTEENLPDTGGVSGYLSYIEDKSKMGVDHEYTNNAIIYLMNAVQAKADELNIDIDADMQEVREQAKAITTDPMANNHAEKIKSAGSDLADVIENLQEENFPDLSQEVQEVKSAVQEIDGSVLTLEQKNEINKFFDEAGDALKKMS